MTLRQKVENNLVVWFLGTLLTGFLAGIGAYKAILQIAHLDVLPQNSYVRVDNPVDKKKLVKNLIELIAEGKALKSSTGEELTNAFAVWAQQGMQATNLVNPETHRLFNNEVYFSHLNPKKKWKPADVEKDVKARISLGIGILEGAVALY